MGRRFIVILFILVAGFIGIIWLGKQDDTNNVSGEAQPTNHVIGNGKTGVKLVEYADFECPSCAAVYPYVKEAVERHFDDITFQYVHFPMPQIHPNSMAAHRSAEAASRQGKFWEMYDQIYTGYQSWRSSTSPAIIFQAYAEQIGLNIDQFNNDVPSSSVNDAIQADLRVVQQLKLNATPTFFLNGEQLEQIPQSADELSDILQAAIDEAKQNTQENSQ